MPKIRITEVDNTFSVIQNSVSNVVYIPCAVTGDEGIAPKQFNSVSELDSAEGYDTDRLSYKLARKLLGYGMYVLVEGVKEATAGVCPTIDWERLKSIQAYDIGFLTKGEYSETDTGMVSCAFARGNSVALCDHPATTITGATGSVAGAVRDYFETNVDSGKGAFSAAFTPGWITKSPDLLVDDNTEERIPASFGYLFAYARAMQFNPEWYAVAGTTRGVIDGISGVEYEYSAADVEILQARASTGEVDLDASGDNVGQAINPISWVRPFGYLVWGNRTMLSNAGSTKATSFLNVRNLVNLVKKQMYNAAIKYTFEQNSDVLWINFKAYITPLLDQMQSGNGILGYRFYKVKTNAKARLKARLVIIPIEAVEDFDLTIELSDSLEIVE